MSNKNKLYQVEHLPIEAYDRKRQKNDEYKGHLEGIVDHNPFFLASSEAQLGSFEHDIPVFPLREPIKKELLGDYLRSLKLTLHQKDALTGLFLGKIATFPSKKDNRVRFTVNLNQKDQLIRLYDLFDPWAIAAPILHERSFKKVHRRRGRRKRANVKLKQLRIRRTKVSMYFEIHDHPLLSYYRDQFFMESYLTGKLKIKKRVPSDIKSMLTSRAVAYLFLDRGFFYPKSSDDTPYWVSYSFRLEHLHYNEQLVKIFSDKFGIDLIRDQDNSHEAYSYNKKNEFTELLYVVGESREKLVSLILFELSVEFRDNIFVSEEYLDMVKERQEATKGLDYDYWFPASDFKRRMGKFNTCKEPLDAVKETIRSTNKLERWLANGHLQLPGELFGLSLRLTDQGLPEHVIPKGYSKKLSKDHIASEVSNAIPSSLREAINADLNNTWQVDAASSDFSHSYTPRYDSIRTFKDVAFVKSGNKDPLVTVKTSFLKVKVRDVLTDPTLFDR
tara:strand:+ start:43 stop:1551 length:1509 start_codon:yes stop_codon:yes gene_type:complete